jgi:hypothetical protein
MRTLSYLVALLFVLSLAAGCCTGGGHGGQKVQVKSNGAGMLVKVHEGGGQNTHIKVKDNPSGLSVKAH